MDLNNYSMRDLMALQTVQVGNQVVGKTKDYSYPKTTLSYVIATDIDGISYVTGSEGQVKLITDYTYDGTNYTVAQTTTLKYENATLPTKVTYILTV